MAALKMMATPIKFGPVEIKMVRQLKNILRTMRKRQKGAGD